MRALAVFVFVLTLIIASGATPLGLPMSTYSVGQLIFTVLLAWIATQAIHLTAKGFGPTRERHYNVEVICLRFRKGFDLVAFTIAVAVPFFVTVMKSLKNQQLLLNNPLDFSINFAHGSDALCRSYIELFT